MTQERNVDKKMARLGRRAFRTTGPPNDPLRELAPDRGMGQPLPGSLLDSSGFFLDPFCARILGSEHLRPFASGHPEQMYDVYTYTDQSKAPPPNNHPPNQ